MISRSIFYLCAALGAAGDVLTIRNDVEEVPERGPVPQLVLCATPDCFRVIALPGWRVNPAPKEQTVSFQNDTLNCVITLRIRLEFPNGKPARVDDRATAQFAGCEVLERLTCVARDSEGDAVAIRFTAADGTTFHARLANLRYGQTRVELTLAGPAEALERAHGAWTALLNSFHRDDGAGHPEKGKP